MKQFICSTIGMLASHSQYNRALLVRVEFYRTDSGILLVPVSGHNLATITKIKQVTISNEEFEDREFDHCNNTVEWEWACRKLGFNFDQEAEE